MQDKVYGNAAYSKAAFDVIIDVKEQSIADYSVATFNAIAYLTYKGMDGW